MLMGLKCFQRPKEAAEAGDAWIRMWILERRFPADFGRCEYRKIKAVSENKNENVDIIIKNSARMQKQFLSKFALGK
jgi:hypothetical protein